MPKQNISATLNSDLLKRLDEFADQTDRNRSWLIGQAVESYLDELEDLRIAKERMHEPRLSPAALKREIGV